MEWRYWEDVELGERTVSRPMVVDPEKMVAFAREYDPQYFHADPVAASGSPFGGLIASGIYTAALWRQLDHETNGRIAFVCGIAWENVKWRRPLRPHDEIRATSVCIAKRASASKPGQGLITLHHAVVKQGGEVVLDFDSVDLVRRRPSAIDSAKTGPEF